jgi:cytochrome c oxidase subunit 4
MSHSHGLSPEAQRKADWALAIKGFIILLLVTLLEVVLALYGGGGILVKLGMIIFSLYKAYYIVSIFMHLGYEIGGFSLMIVLPFTLLIWAVIAFLWEGNSVRESRNRVKDPRPGAIGMQSIDKTSMQSIDLLSKEFYFG